MDANGQYANKDAYMKTMRIGTDEIDWEARGFKYNKWRGARDELRLLAEKDDEAERLWENPAVVDIDTHQYHELAKRNGWKMHEAGFYLNDADTALLNTAYFERARKFFPPYKLPLGEFLNWETDTDLVPALQANPTFEGYRELLKSYAFWQWATPNSWVANYKEKQEFKMGWWGTTRPAVWERLWQDLVLSKQVNPSIYEKTTTRVATIPPKDDPNRIEFRLPTVAELARMKEMYEEQEKQKEARAQEKKRQALEMAKQRRAQDKELFGKSKK